MDTIKIGVLADQIYATGRKGNVARYGIKVLCKLLFQFYQIHNMPATIKLNGVF